MQNGGGGVSLCMGVGRGMCSVKRNRYFSKQSESYRNISNN